jgi:AcrR family transcriptional regulator
MNRRSFHRAGEAERRRDLIAATLDVVAEQGLRAATVRQISARAGVTGGLIRHYFTSKDQMVQAAYRELMQGMIRSVEEAARNGATERERLRAFIAGNLSRDVTNARTISLWAAFIGHVSVDPEFAAIHREYYLAFLERLEAMIGAYLESIGRPVAAPALRGKAIAINGLIDGLWLENSVASDLFTDRDPAELALRSVEDLLGIAPGSLD